MFEPGGALRSASKPFLSQYTLKQLGVCHCAGAGVGNIAETIQGANHFTGWCSLMCVSRSSGRPQERSLRDVFCVRRCDLESVFKSRRMECPGLSRSSRIGIDWSGMSGKRVNEFDAVGA